MKKTFTLFFLLAGLQLHAQWQTFTTANVPELKSDDIRSVVVSPDDNNKWFGTANGLTRFDGNTWITYTRSSDDIAGDEVNDINYDKTDFGPELWLSTRNGATVLSIEVDGISSATPYRTGNTGIASDTVYSNGISAAGTKIFGTGRGVSTFANSEWMNITGTDSTNLAKHPVKSIGTSSDGYSYLGSTGSGIYQYEDGVDGLSLVTIYEIPWSNVPSENILSVYVDSDGNQWYGSDAGVKFHQGILAKEGWDVAYYTTENGLPDSTVNAIIQDSRGNMWFGTNNGLALRQGDQWKIFTTDDGLSGNTIRDIAEDNSHVIWVATDNGISKYTPDWVGIQHSLSPASFRLTVHPNPARDGVWIKYILPNGGPTRVAVFDLSGRMIKQLQYGFNVAGEHEIFWNTAGENGDYADAGIYVVRIQSNNLSTTQKMIILR